MTKRMPYVPICLTALALTACTGAGPDVGDSASTSRTAPSAPLSQPFVDADTGRALGGNQQAALDGLARGASAGTLLARSQDGTVCVFANGRDGWNRAAC